MPTGYYTIDSHFSSKKKDKKVSYVLWKSHSGKKNKNQRLVDYKSILWGIRNSLPSQLFTLRLFNLHLLGLKCLKWKKWRYRSNNRSSFWIFQCYLLFTVALWMTLGVLLAPIQGMLKKLHSSPPWYTFIVLLMN